jgi:tetratricopeptide (TPR) repeat protein
MPTWVLLLGMTFAAAVPVQAPVQEPVDQYAVTRLPDELLTDLDRRVLVGAHSPEQRLTRVLAYMLEPKALGLTYANDYTRTVAETVRDRKGNCLSFTLTFLALAKAAGVQAHMQEADQALILVEQDSKLLFVGHVLASARVGRQRFDVNFDPERPLLRGGRDIVGPRRGLAHYYNNRGAELMGAGDLASAALHFDQAIGLDPDMPAAQNNRGVLHMRLGQRTEAERRFKRSLELAPDSLSTLSNLVALYRQAGDSGRAAATLARLNQEQRNDPQHQFVLGMHLEQQGRLDEALAHFQQAATLRRREPMFQEALARLYRALGDTERAARHQHRADRLNARQTSSG